MTEKTEQVLKRYEDVLIKNLETYEKGEAIKTTDISALNDCIRVMQHITQVRGYVPASEVCRARINENKMPCIPDEKTEQIFEKYESILIKNLERHGKGEAINAADVHALSESIRMLHHIRLIRGYVLLNEADKSGSQISEKKKIPCHDNDTETSEGLFVLIPDDETHTLILAPFAEGQTAISLTEKTAKYLIAMIDRQIREWL